MWVESSKRFRHKQIPPLLEPIADPVQIWTYGEATALDVPAADPTRDLPSDLGERRLNPILGPGRSGGRGNGHGQAARVGATGFGVAGAAAGFYSTTSSQRSYPIGQTSLMPPDALHVWVSWIGQC